jgi:hypothetical protein
MINKIMVKKVIGYVVSVFGIVVMAVGFNIIPLNWDTFNLVNSTYIGGAGFALVGVGVVFSLMGGKKSGHKGGENESPIFEGVGKSRRIVGYRRG